jgi:hypothetical protein
VVVRLFGVSVILLTLYTFLPVAYPDISSTELWICAHVYISEMAVRWVQFMECV